MQPIPYLGERLKGKWLVEPKIDGWRMLILKDKRGKIEYWGRRLEKNPNWTKNLSYLNPSLLHLPRGTILDAELYSSQGRNGIPSVLSHTNKAKPLIFIFDVIFFRGKFVGKMPLIQRKRILKKIKFLKPFVVLESKPLKDLNKSLKEALLQGYEGIVIKKINSCYQISKEAPIATLDWRKIKP